MGGCRDSVSDGLLLQQRPHACSNGQGGGKEEGGTAAQRQTFGVWPPEVVVVVVAGDGVEDGGHCTIGGRGAAGSGEGGGRGCLWRSSHWREGGAGPLPRPPKRHMHSEQKGHPLSSRVRDIMDVPSRAPSGRAPWLPTRPACRPPRPLAPPPTVQGPRNHVEGVPRNPPPKANAITTNALRRARSPLGSSTRRRKAG